MRPHQSASCHACHESLCDEHVLLAFDVSLSELVPTRLLLC